MVGSVEGINKIKTGTLLTLSGQEVLDCSSYGDCRGGNPWNAFMHAIDHGLAVDSSGNPPYYPPYVAKKEDCRFDPVRAHIYIPRLSIDH